MAFKGLDDIIVYKKKKEKKRIKLIQTIVFVVVVVAKLTLLKNEEKTDLTGRWVPCDCFSNRFNYLLL